MVARCHIFRINDDESQRRSLKDKHVLMDIRRAATLSGVEVALMAGFARVSASFYMLEMG